MFLFSDSTTSDQKIAAMKRHTVSKTQIEQAYDWLVERNSLYQGSDTNAISNVALSEKNLSSYPDGENVTPKGMFQVYLIDGNILFSIHLFY